MKRNAFTLLELIVVIAIVALVLAVLLPAVGLAGRSGHKVRELSLARQLMAAWAGYAHDHRGVVLPGYYSLDGQTLPAKTETGDLPGVGVQAAGYVWRLAPWLGFDPNGLYIDSVLLAEINRHRDGNDPDRGLYLYLTSVFPAMGINSVFVGGDTGTYAYDETYLDFFGGPFYVTRLSQVRHPGNLLVFASARDNGTDAASLYPDGRTVEGYFRVRPPAFAEREWADAYVPDCDASAGCSTRHFGQVSLRHDHRSAVAGFVDGHAEALDEGGIQDMRHWADRATRPDWTYPLP